MKTSTPSSAAKKLAALLLFSALAFAAKTTVSDNTLRTADGKTVSGTIMLTPSQRWVAVDGYTITTSPIIVHVQASVFSVDLEPNDAGTPSNTHYNAHYQLTGEARQDDTWFVPTSGTAVTLAAVELFSAPVPASGGYITKLNGLSTTTQTFANANDTNVTLGISSSLSTHTFTMGWTGLLGVARGGTGAGTLTPHGVLLGEGTSPITPSSAGLLGQCFISNGASADPTFQTCGSGSGITALTGDVTATGPGSAAATVVKVNGVTYGTSPSTNTAPIVTGANTITYEAVPNAALANSSVTIAGHSVSLGGTQALSAADLSNGVSGSGAVCLASGSACAGSGMAIGSSISGAAGPQSLYADSSNKLAQGLTEYWASWYNFAAQSPGGSLTGGSSNTVTLSPCPAGVNGTDSGHYLYVSGGTGTAEAVLITGGTCTSEAASGNVTFTPANAHSGAWTIQSATAGIQEAVQVAQTAGSGMVRMACGTYPLYGPIVKSPYSVWIKGGGMGCTTLRVTAVGSGDAVNFPSVNGVYEIPDDSSLTDRGPMSGGLADLTISFYQNQTTSTLAGLVTWPAAIYGTNVQRAIFENVKWTLAWDGVKISGGTGFSCFNCSGSAYDHGIDVDSITDSVRIDNFHAFPYAANAGSNLATLFVDGDATHTGPYAFWIGRSDDMQVSGCAENAYAGADIHKGSVAGYPWVAFSRCDFDVGRVSVTAGKVMISDSTIGANGSYALNYGPLSPANAPTTIWANNDSFQADSTATAVPMITVDFSNTSVAFNADVFEVFFTNCQFYNDSSSQPDTLLVKSTGSSTGTVHVTHSKFSAPLAFEAVFSGIMIHETGPVAVIATGNDVEDKISAAGTWFSADTDYGNVITNNQAFAWSMVYPTTQVNSIYADNLGVTNPVPVSSAVASATSITPTGRLFHVTGTVAIATIVATTGLDTSTVTGFHQLTIIPDGAFTTTTGGNIGAAITATVGRPIQFTYDTATSKWYPSQ